MSEVRTQNGKIAGMVDTQTCTLNTKDDKKTTNLLRFRHQRADDVRITREHYLIV